MNRIFTVCALFVIFFTDSKGQTPGPFYRQFFFNPYLFNPAYVGIHGEPEANLVYRHQWANFKESPVTAGINAQFPMSDRVALGFSMFTDKQVMLRNSNFMATFGYIVPLSETQSLRFGLSGGVGLNKLDLTAEELSSNDPAIINAAGNNFYVDGNFGTVYSFQGFRAGIAITNIFKTKAFNTENFKSFELSKLRNRIFSLSYRFNLGVMGNFSMEPYILYRQAEDKVQDAWEAAALVYFKDQFWTGAGYNQHNGLALFLGMSVKGRLRFSYSYEFPPFTQGLPSNSSHEIHLGIRLGKKKVLAKQPAKSEVLAVKTEGLVRARAVNDPADSVYRDDDGNKLPARRNEANMETPIVIGEEARVKPAGQVPTAQHAPESGIKKVVEKVKDALTSSDKKPTEISTEAVASPLKKADVKKEPPVPARESFTITPGHYYVVVGVFSVMSHSMKFSKEMIAKGYRVNVVLNPKNNFYYVYVHSTLDAEEAKRVRNEYRWKHLLKEAWIFSMD